MRHRKWNRCVFELWGAFPRETFTLPGMKDFMLYPRAVGTAERHCFRCRDCGRTTGALVFNLVCCNAVNSFAGTFALKVKENNPGLALRGHRNSSQLFNDQGMKAGFKPGYTF